MPVAVKVRPGPELLQRCEWPIPPDPAKTVSQNSEALIDLAEKFRACEARHTKLVEWFGEQPQEPTR